MRWASERCARRKRASSHAALKLPWEMRADNVCFSRLDRRIFLLAANGRQPPFVSMARRDVALRTDVVEGAGTGLSLRRA